MAQNKLQRHFLGGLGIFHCKVRKVLFDGNVEPERWILFGEQGNSHAGECLGGRTNAKERVRIDFGRRAAIPEAKSA